MKLWRVEQDTKYTEGVTARKEERARVRKVEELQVKQVPYPPELDIPIPDPDMIWKASDPTWQAEEARKAKLKRKKPGISDKNKEKGEGEEEEDTEFVPMYLFMSLSLLLDFSAEYLQPRSPASDTP